MTETELKVRPGAPEREVDSSQPTDKIDRVTVIKPALRRPHLDVSELWHFRELLGRLPSTRLYSGSSQTSRPVRSRIRLWSCRACW